MALTAEASTRVGSPQARRIWMGSLGLVVLLITQYVLGVAYNLYGTAPTPTKKVKLFSSALLGAHVIVGTLLVLVAIYVVVVSIRARERVPVTGSILGLASIIGAWTCGSAFTQNGESGFSMAMAALTAVALLCYIAIVTVLSVREESVARRPAKYEPPV